MTDLAHVNQLLHETAHRERYHLPALRDWLRRRMKDRAGRLDATAGWTAMPRRFRS